MGQVFRFAIIALAIWLAFLLLRRALRSDSPRPRSRASAPPKMLPCASCGVHVPEAEALMRDGRTYCCEEHLPPDRR